MHLLGVAYLPLWVGATRIDVIGFISPTPGSVFMTGSIVLDATQRGVGDGRIPRSSHETTSPAMLGDARLVR